MSLSSVDSSHSYGGVWCEEQGNVLLIILCVTVLNHVQKHLACSLQSTTMFIYDSTFFFNECNISNLK